MEGRYDKTTYKELKKGARWFHGLSQGRGKPNKQYATNLIMTAITVLADSPRDYSNRLVMLSRGLSDIPSRHAMKKWAGEFSKLLKLAISDLDAWPRAISGLAIGSNHTRTPKRVQITPKKPDDLRTQIRKYREALL